MNVLIVDPDHSRASQYAMELESLKLEVSIVHDSRAAILHCQNNKIELLICRAILDDLTGYEVLSKIGIPPAEGVLTLSSDP
jgi:DNA-binding response OmpR family regulator